MFIEFFYFFVYLVGKGGDLKVGLSNGVLTISYPRLSVNATERIKIE